MGHEKTIRLSLLFLDTLKCYLIFTGHIFGFSLFEIFIS